MPSERIQTTSVTCGEPGQAAVAAGDQRDREAERGERAKQCSQARQARAAPADARRAGAVAAGSQIRSESISASALQQEVEADAGDADEDQRHVEAQEAALGAAHERRAGAHERRCVPPTSRPLTKTRSKVFCAKRPNQAAGRTTSGVDQLVEVPLLLEQRGERAKARGDRRGDRRSRDPDDVGGRDRGEPDHRSEDQAEVEQAVGGVRRPGSSRRTSARGTCRATWSCLGIATIPPTVASSASRPIATRIGSSRSAITWSGPGKPTSVSSISPLAGLVGAAGGRGGRARSARAPPGRARQGRRGRSCRKV